MGDGTDWKKSFSEDQNFRQGHKALTVRFMVYHV